MKVFYDDKQKAYIAKLENLEEITFINTDDIVEARKIFIEHMTSLFNNAICKQLKN